MNKILGIFYFALVSPHNAYSKHIFSIDKDYRPVKTIFYRFFFLLLVSLTILSVNVDLTRAQTMTVDDPMFQYLRLLETGNDSTQLPSLMLRPVSAEDYLQQLELKETHPWSTHPFFEKDVEFIEIIEEVTTQDSVQTHKVKQGETVYRISRMYGITEAELIEWNNIQNNTLLIDQELIVEKPKQSVVKIVKTIPKEPSGSESILQFYSPVVRTTFNNNYPIGQNDGALWQGKGLNTKISAGAYLSYGPVKASIRPNFIYSANEDFTLSRWPAPEGISDFGYEFTVIDYPQRFGTEPVSKFDPGQSWIRAEYNEFGIGISTANMWLGPAVYNPIMLSNNAPGFPHIFIGTHEPYQTGIGSFEGQIFWGRLDESGYFDEDESNDSRMINGLTFIYSPKYVKGLHVGLSKIAVKPQSDLSFGDYFLALRRMQYGQPSEIDRLQMFSLFSRWRIPDYGFEFYAEWARNTPAKSFRDLLLEPEYTRVYTMGFFKRFNLASQHWLTLNFELTQIERPRSVEFRPSQPFYRSSSVIQGYTHEGQILGAGIGPGSNSQKVHLSYFLPRGMFGISFNRIVHDNTRLYENIMVIGERPWGIRNPRIVNEVEFRFGINALVFLLDRLELQADLYRSKYFHHEHGILDFENPIVYNTNLQFTLRYNFDNFLR